MSLLTFVKNWTLPISMLIGASSYVAYINIPALDGTHAIVSTSISYIQPLFIFCMLYVSFCRVAVRDLKPHTWMLKPLAIQCLSFVAMGLVLILAPSTPWRVVIESAMICMICPTATAAAVVTTRLQGNASAVVSYTCLINLAASLLIPAVVPLLNEGAHQHLSFETSFILIIGKVFPLLILPLLAAWLTRHLAPRLHAYILQQKNLAFNLWAVSLALAIAVTAKAIHHTQESMASLAGIAVASLLACLVQFACGRIIGKNNGETVAGTQLLGQKNTVFAIWMGYTFLDPVTAIAGGFYSVWHNTVNSYQLWTMRKQTT